MALTGMALEALAILRVVPGPAGWLAVGGILLSLHDLWRHFAGPDGA